MGTIIFFPEGAFGPTNNCVGTGDVLRQRGHRVVFMVEESFAGTLAAKGFEERRMRLGAAPEEPEEPGQFWKDFIRDTAPVFRQSSFDQLGGFIAPTWEALLNGARFVDQRLVEIIGELAPDVIVQDNVCATDEPWTAPESPAPLAYVSLGSLGSADVPLMKRLIEVLAGTPHRYVVSTGPQHQQYELAANMIGAEFLPQVSVLPQVDAVITHGGNNTTTECLWFGKPMIVLPIFWDQHDNAQRVDETGYGVRLSTYSFADEQLVAAIARVLSDEPLRARAAAAGARLRGRSGAVAAADLIERVAETGEPVRQAY